MIGTVKPGDAVSAAPVTGPLVSVIVPTFNRAGVLPEALASAFAQTYRHIEVIVVDDGSTDETPSVMEGYSQRATYVRTPNGGPGAARNAGLKHAKGEFIAWLDSDDVWAPEKLAIDVATLQRHPEVVLVSSDFWAFDKQGVREASHIATYYSILRRFPAGPLDLYPRQETILLPTPSGAETVRVLFGNVYEALVLGSFVHPPTASMRRTALDAVGGLVEELGGISEYDLFLKLASLGSFAYVDRATLGYRYSDDQLSADANLLRLRLAILRVITDLGRRDPAYVASHPAEYGRRLAECHFGVAVAASDEQPSLALRHVWHTLRRGHLDARMPRVFVKALLPRSILRRLHAPAVPHRDS